MLNSRRLFLVIIFALTIAGCGKTTLVPQPTNITNNLIATPNQLESTAVSTDSASYPAPNSASEEIQGEVVTRLAIPTPSSGKAVVSGQLSETGNDVFYITRLYLSPINQPGSTEGQPTVNFSEETDPIATLEIGTGRFMFIDITPGEYALVIWTAMKAYPIQDAQGNTIIFSVNPGENKDLGVIFVK